MKTDLEKNARERELAVVDAVVRGGGHMKPEDAALVDFALLVRSARPLPDHGVQARLDERVAAAQAPPRRPRRPRESRRALIAGFASILLVAGAVFAGGNVLISPGRDDAAISDLEGAARSESAPAKSVGSKKAVQLQESVSADIAKVPYGVEPVIEDPGSGSAANATPGTISGGARRQERSARLAIAATPRRFDRVADRITQIAGEYGGFVQSASVKTNDRDRARGSFLLMIPALRYQEAVNEIARLGHVRSRSESTNDITSEFNSAERALQARRDRVKKLEAQLQRAEGQVAVDRIARKLRDARAAERQALQRVRSTRARVRFVPLEVKLTVDKGAEAAARGPIGNAFASAGEILTTLAAWAIVGLAVLVPLGLIGAALAWLARSWRRRRSDGIVAAAAAQPE